MISFVIPALNEEQNIARCIRSIQDDMRATGTSAEIVVVDNGSEDRTSEIAREFGVIVMIEPRKGTNRARQTGFEHLNAPLVAFIDADCELCPGWIARALQRMSTDAGVACVAGPYRFNGPLWFKAGAWLAFASIKFLNRAGLHTMMGGNYLVRSSYLLAIGGHNTGIAFYGDDCDTAKRLAAVGRVVFDLQLKVKSSDRRFRQEGYLRTLWNYGVVGFLGTHFSPSRPRSFQTPHPRLRDLKPIADIGTRPRRRGEMVTGSLIQEQ